jgi:hypothetical protein
VRGAVCEIAIPEIKIFFYIIIMAQKQMLQVEVGVQQQVRVCRAKKSRAR